MNQAQVKLTSLVDWLLARLSSSPGGRGMASSLAAGKKKNKNHRKSRTIHSLLAHSLQDPLLPSQSSLHTWYRVVFKHSVLRIIYALENVMHALHCSLWAIQTIYSGLHFHWQRWNCRREIYGLFLAHFDTMVYGVYKP